MIEVTGWERANLGIRLDVYSALGTLRCSEDGVLWVSCLVGEIMLPLLVTAEAIITL